VPKPDLAIQQASTSAPVVAAKSPLMDRRERPAVGNTGRSGRLSSTADNLALMQRAIAFERESLHIDPNDRDAQRRLERLQQNYNEMLQVAHEQRQRE
jgi:hypothetical protein